MMRELQARSVGPLVEVVRRERGVAVVFLDEGATEAVRWAGGVRWAVEAMGLRGPWCLRSLSEPGEGQYIITDAVETTAVVVVCDRLDPESRAAATRAARECQASRVVACCEGGDAPSDWVISRGACPRFVAPFCALDETSENDGVPPIATLSSPRLAGAFPALPWHRRRGGGTRADALGDDRRAMLRDLAGAVARLCVQLGVDAHRNVFAVGDTAALVGTAALPGLLLPRNKAANAAKRAALVVVDRTIDLPSALAGPTDAASFVSRAAHSTPRNAWRYSCDATVAAPRWTSRPVGRSVDPFPALRDLERWWPASPGLAAAPSRRFVRAALLLDGDGALDSLAAACRSRVREPAPHKPGRGKGAELFEQTKVLVRESNDDLAPVAALAVEATQRTRKPKHFDDLESTADRLVAAGANADDLYAVAADALDRDRATPAQALAVAAKAVARCGGPVSSRPCRRLARALASKHRPVDPRRLRRIGRLPPAETTTLASLIIAILEAQDLGDLCVPVGGALESFGAAVGNAIGIGRLRKHHKKPADDAALLVFFVVGGISVHEISLVARYLLAKGRRPGDALVLASTTLSSPDLICAHLLDDDDDLDFRGVYGGGGGDLVYDDDDDDDLYDDEEEEEEEAGSSPSSH